MGRFSAKFSKGEMYGLSSSTVLEVSIYDNFDRTGQWTVPPLGNNLCGKLVRDKGGTRLSVVHPRQPLHPCWRAPSRGERQPLQPLQPLQGRKSGLLAGRRKGDPAAQTWGGGRRPRRGGGGSLQ